MMHPKYKGTKLNEQQQEEARVWITGRNPDLLPFVLSFGEEDGDHYPGSFFQPHVISKLDPVSWWKSMKRATNTQEMQALADVMIHLLGYFHVQQVQHQLHESFPLLDLSITNCETVLVLSVRQNWFFVIACFVEA